MYIVMRIPITTTIDYDLKKKMDKLVGVTISECLEFGCDFALAERGIIDEFPRNVLSDKIESMAEHLNNGKK